MFLLFANVSVFTHLPNYQKDGRPQKCQLEKLWQSVHPCGRSLWQPCGGLSCTQHRWPSLWACLSVLDLQKPGEQRGNGGRAASVWRCLKESLHEAHHEGFEDAQAAAPDGDVTPFTDSDVAEWRLLGNGKNTNCWLPLRRNNTDNRLTGSTGQILVFFYETLFI